MLGAKAVFHYEDMDLDRKYGRKEKKNMVYAWSNSKTAPSSCPQFFVICLVPERSFRLIHRE